MIIRNLCLKKAYIHFDTTFCVNTVSVVLALQCLSLHPRPSYIYTATHRTKKTRHSISYNTYEHFPLYPAHPVISMCEPDRTVS
jgi:hypothetical protein